MAIKRFLSIQYRLWCSDFQNILFLEFCIQTKSIKTNKRSLFSGLNPVYWTLMLLPKKVNCVKKGSTAWASVWKYLYLILTSPDEFDHFQLQLLYSAN